MSFRVVLFAAAALVSLVAGCNPRGATRLATVPRTPVPAASSCAPRESCSSTETSPPTAARGLAADAGAGQRAVTRSFDDDIVGRAPAGFSFGRTGEGAAGRWVVQAEAAGNALAQLDADDTDGRYPLAVLDAPVLRDARVSVRCKMVAGQVDRACGLVSRYRDEGNYYVTRANALEGNVRLYTVRDGQRRQLASWSGPVSAGVWHELQLITHGDRLEVYWNGERVIDHHDATFDAAGRAGVWTKADSITWFDDLRVEESP
jgi:hypothetical protein